MTDNLPVNFRKSNENVVASYDFTDISEGTGVVTYYGFATKDVNGVSYGLTTNAAFESQPIYDSSTPPTTYPTYNMINDYKFNTTFNLPKSIKGMASLNCPVYGDGNQTGNLMAFVSWSLVKLSGSEVSVLGSAQSYPLQFGTAYNDRDVASIKIPINSVVNFKKGDILQSWVQYWACLTGGSGAGGLMFDPSNRSTLVANVPTKMMHFIPFRIDL